jgi:transcription elongation factor GreA
MRKLEEVHSNARLIDETNLDLSKVFASIVKIKNQTNGMELKYTWLQSEADLKTGDISNFPIGKVTRKVCR